LRTKLEIINFHPDYGPIFKELNIEWLEKYFYVEPYDEKILGNPESYIIKKGGYIFFAKINSKIVGTVALINQKECYELSKMAVSPKYQGLKIGHELINHCIAFSRQQGWSKIMLYSNTILKTAIYLYKKVGFKKVKLEDHVNYDRANIKMILRL